MAKYRVSFGRDFSRVFLDFVSKMRIYLALLLILQLSCLTLAQNDKVASVPAAVAEKNQDDFLKNPETPVKSEPVIKGAVVTPDKAEKIVKDEQKKVPVNDESKKLLVKDEPKKVPELIKESIKEEIKKDLVKEDVKKESVKEEVKKDPVKESVKKESVKEEVKKESVVKEDVKKKPVKEEVKKEPVKEEVKTKVVEKETDVKIEDKVDVKKEEKVDVKKEEIKKDENKKEEVKKQDEKKADEAVVEDDVFNDPINENVKVDFPGQFKNAPPGTLPSGATCTVVSNGIETPGVCISFPECTFYGSFPPAGSTLKDNLVCNGLNTCCTSKQTCGGNSNLKVSTFVSPTSPTSPTGPTTCTDTIKLIHGNVCQIRLDFDVFNLQTGVQSGTTNLCTIDSLTAGGLTMPTMCGCNPGQHLYLYVNSATTTTFTLTVNLAARPAGNLYVIPSWSIRITQLECPEMNPHRRSIDNPQEIPDPVFSLVNSKTAPKVPRKFYVATDYPFLAPYDCLQYFTSSSGTIRSLGYHAACTNNFFITNPTDYAICIKKPVGICSVKLTVVTFGMGAAMATATKFGYTDCATGTINSWLEFYNAVYLSGTTSMNIGRVCGGSKVGDTITITSPGPFCFIVHRPAQPAAALTPGYDFTYSLIAC